MKKINRNFINNNIDYIWALILIFFIIFYLIFYICIILYIFLIGNNSLYNLDSNKICDKINNLFICKKKEKKKEHKKEKSEETLSSEPSDKNDSEHKCLFCLTEKAQVIFAPCGHKCCCKACYQTNKNNMKNCPCCRANILCVIEKIFKV